MSSQSTKHGPDKIHRPALLRVLSVMLMACGAFVVLSGQAVDAEPNTPEGTVRAAPAPAPTPDAGSAVLPASSEPNVWAEIYTTVSRLADSGSVSASRLALQMHRFGPTIYGMSFEASDWQLQRWQWQLECGRCEPCINYG